MTESNRLIAGRYQLGALIGRGGMAEVYSGTDTRLGRTVAIKLLKADLAADSSFEIRFRQEAQASARMAHPTIVRVYDAGDEVRLDENGVERHLPYIVMELVRGEVLRDILRQRKLTQQEAIAYATGVLTALEFSHAAGVIHRDIKPANVMITESNAVKVMDFGIARAVSDSSATMAHTNGIVGTAQYFSPEQARGETVDLRTDLYSTGVLLYEMLTGKPPFTGDTAVSVAYQHVSEQAIPPSMINPGVSLALDSVIMKALAKERSQRFQSAGEFRSALARAAAGVSVPVFQDDAQPPTAPMEPVTVAETIVVPEVDPFDELIASVNEESTEGISLPEPEEVALDEDNSFTALGFETGANQVITRSAKKKNSSDKPSAGLIWGIGSGAGVVVIGLLVWLLAGGAALLSFGGGGGGKIAVADVVGKTYEEAYTILSNQDLLVDRQLQQSQTVPVNTVISTDPPAGQQVGMKTTITVFVSAGAEQVTMPDLSGMTEQEAIAALFEAKLVLGTITQNDSATVAENLVISSDPPANQMIAAGSTINLITSTGMVIVPNVVNLELVDAQAQLTSTSVGYTVSTQVDSTCTGTAGTTVIAQSIPQGLQPQLQNIVLTLQCVTN
ncbi:MAG: Stk1 family PASTA domain-containing Ser/Thr kinase [Micrococcales bacterium]|nr:Stk1 family PASTA domain-containing Ser/Thr kinase [Micrococcales bacterium]NBR61192.1 Stk1 family PASTA domain-containing Ser/Thr kinase [Actinomycetota bacterium]NBR55292.1 Stk1 family PASTA domain-containing Ser/Thr kinase [Micrococcales bacterium]NBT47362.1 Stk1 family PASTA domain-containing Ser/Thr kinase [Actinomycetota bacterium]NBY43701.1 Stk1 family PASTA domain-containing Ser/Thr kinase [Micrococcales bacterium]